MGESASTALKNDTKNITRVTFTNNLGKYLGLPLLNDRVSKVRFNFVIQKIQNRLTGWKAQNLSLAGRRMLIQSVLAGIPTYAMQSVWLPQATCNALLEVQIQDKNILHLIKWEKITKLNAKGGLVIHEARSANTAQLAKIRSRLITGSDTPCARVLRSKYIKQGSFKNWKIKQNQSSTWKGIIKSMNMVTGGYRWKLGCFILVWYMAGKWMALLNYWRHWPRRKYVERSGYLQMKMVTGI